jgi:hypothetical protein
MILFINSGTEKEQVKAFLFLILIFQITVLNNSNSIFGDHSLWISEMNDNNVIRNGREEWKPL